MSEQTLSIIAIVISIIGGTFVYVEGVIRVRERIVAVETKVSLFWDTIAKDAAKILHTPHPMNFRRDQLLEKFVDGTINREELKELIEVLQKIIEGKDREFGERTAASTLLRAIEMKYTY